MEGIRSGISVYLLVAIVKKQLNVDPSLYSVLQVLRVKFFEKAPILRAFSTSETEQEKVDPGNQLYLIN
jgi:hypothetical protein